MALNSQTLLITVVSLAALSCRAPAEPSLKPSASAPAPAKAGKEGDRIVKTKEEWKKLLTPEQYRVLRESGTERAFTGAYWKTKTPGVYLCAACGEELFSSEHKFDSGTGWPSFYQPAAEGKVETETDTAFGMVRKEVHCRRCGGHLGHIFDDGPKPTGLRYCINSLSLKLKPKE